MLILAKFSREEINRASFYTTGRCQGSNLIRLGVSERLAISLGMSSKGYYRLAKTKAVQLGMTNQWLEAQGLVSIKKQWVNYHYPNG